MASVFDVAKYILEKKGMMTAMKLQKLVYYSQAWSLVWDDEPMFSEKIEAWANGPVVRELFDAHRGQFRVSTVARGDVDNLSPDNIETIDAVLSGYGNRSSQWLSDLTHQERPWKKTRRNANLTDGERGSAEITHSLMAEYYSNL